METFERETIIRFDEADQILNIYTAAKRVADKLFKAGMVTEKTDTRDEAITGWYFSGPSSLLILKPGKRGIHLGTRPKVPG